VDDVFTIINQCSFKMNVLNKPKQTALCSTMPRCLQEGCVHMLECGISGTQAQLRDPHRSHSGGPGHGRDASKLYYRLREYLHAPKDLLAANALVGVLIWMPTGDSTGSRGFRPCALQSWAGVCRPVQGPASRGTELKKDIHWQAGVLSKLRSDWCVVLG
jgi:hypothetical protein